MENPRPQRSPEEGWSRLFRKASMMFYLLHQEEAQTNLRQAIAELPILSGEHLQRQVHANCVTTEEVMARRTEFGTKARCLMSCVLRQGANQHAQWWRCQECMVLYPRIGREMLVQTSRPEEETGSTDPSARGSAQPAPRQPRKAPCCPRCSSIMEQRVNRKTGGEFWGCTQFGKEPSCLGTRPGPTWPTMTTEPPLPGQEWLQNAPARGSKPPPPPLPKRTK